jgi:hypothetical protein
MDELDRQTIKMMQAPREPEPLALVVEPEPEPELCRCCRRVLVLNDDEVCRACKAIPVLRREAA